MARNPIELDWNLVIDAPLDRVWAVFSDTDRFSREAGFGMVFEEDVRDDGTVHRFGTSTRFGKPIRFEEIGLWFEAPNWLRQERQYNEGPIELIETEMSLESVDDGTALRFTLWVHPRSSQLRSILETDAKKNLRPAFDQGLKMALEHIAETTDYGWDDSVLPGKIIAEINALASAIEPPKVGKLLGNMVACAPDDALVRIQPLELAEKHALSEEDSIFGCLDAVTKGLLELRWELLCPSCMVSKSTSDTFDPKPTSVHCPSCNIRFDGTFADNVNVIFRPVPRLREVHTKIDCALSPGRTPHVLVRDSVPGREQKHWSSIVLPGGYLIDIDNSRSGCAVRCHEGGTATEVTLDVTRHGVRPRSIDVAPGRVTIYVRNRLPEDCEISVRRRWRPPHTLTAGRLLAMQGVADLVPKSALAEGLNASVKRAAVVAIDVRSRDVDLLADVVKAAESRTRLLALRVGNGQVLTAWENDGAALAWAGEVAGEPELAVGVAVGPITELTSGDDVSIAGGAVDAALKVVRAIGAGRVGLDSESEKDPGLAVVLGKLSRLIQTGKRCSAGYVRLHYPAATTRLTARVEAARKATEGLAHVGERYAIIKKLGQGGMGLVYEVLDTEVARTVVIKLLKPELANDAGHVQRFYNEARITAEVRSPHIPTVHDWGTDEKGNVFLVMDKLDGEELLDRLRREGTLNAVQARQVGQGVLAALEVAHARGIVHRDIKPANIFIEKGEDGTEVVMLIDFGIAQAMDEHDELAASGIVVGTLPYLSPEQIRRKSLDGRSDLYTLGIVLSRCLSGRLPFRSPTARESARERVRQPPLTVDQLVTGSLPTKLVRALERATRVKPDDRFPDAQSMSRALGGE